MINKLYYLVLLFLRIFRSERSNASEPFGIFFVITLPAPTLELASKITGAINEEFEPMKTLSLIIVLCFLFPSCILGSYLPEEFSFCGKYLSQSMMRC